MKIEPPTQPLPDGLPPPPKDSRYIGNGSKAIQPPEWELFKGYAFDSECPAEGWIAGNWRGAVTAMHYAIID